MVSGWRKLPHPECLDLELAKPSYLTSGQVMSDPGSGLPMGSDEARVQFQFNFSLHPVLLPLLPAHRSLDQLLFPVHLATARVITSAPNICPFPLCENTAGRQLSVNRPGRGGLTRTSHAGTLIWDFPSLWITRNCVCYLNHSAYAFCYSTQNQLKHV